MKKWLIDRGGALVLLVLATYLLLAPTTVVDGDNAEFATLGSLGGRAHPSGYPVYVLFLRATSWLPGSSAAHTGALATALLGVAAVAVLHAACRAWGARPAAATIACALYAASPVVLRVHTEAEVFALNGLVAATILWLAAERGPLRGARRGFALGLVAGLGLGDHVTCALLAPVGLYGVVRAAREAPRRWLPVVLAVAGLALGLASYLYLFVADGPTAYGKVDDLGDVVNMFLRTDYGGPGAFAARDRPPIAGANLAALGATLGRAWLWMPGLAGLAMLVVAALRDRGEATEGRWGWRMLLVSFALAGPLIVMRFNLEPVGLFRHMVQRFHLLPLLLLAPGVALGLDRLAQIVAARVPDLARLGAPGTATALGGVLYVVLVVIGLPRLRAQHSVATQRGVENLLRSLPPRAVVVTQSDDVCLIGAYLREAEALRPDVDIVCWLRTSNDWYREVLARRGLPLRHGFTLQPSLAEADAILASGRPLFTDRNAPGLLASRPSYPWGITVRVLPATTAMPSPHELVETNRALFAKFDLDYPAVGSDDDWATVAQKRYAVTWLILADYLSHHGSPEAAEDARALAAQYAPHD